MRSPSTHVSRYVLRDDEVLPVLWQDNYFSLLPGETRQISASFKTEDLDRTSPLVEVQGWNVKTKVIQP